MKKWFLVAENVALSTDISSLPVPDVVSVEINRGNYFHDLLKAYLKYYERSKI